MADLHSECKCKWGAEKLNHLNENYGKHRQFCRENGYITDGILILLFKIIFWPLPRINAEKVMTTKCGHTA